MEKRWKIVLRRKEAWDILAEQYEINMNQGDYIGLEETDEHAHRLDGTYKTMITNAEE